MLNMLGDNAPSNATVKNWFTEFKRSRTHIDDDSHRGHPKIASSAEIIEQIYGKLKKKSKYLNA